MYSNSVDYFLKSKPSFTNMSLSIGGSLIGKYDFTGNANDTSGAGIFGNGTANGAILATDRFGAANSCYSFDGVDDYIELADGQTPTELSIAAKETNVQGITWKPDGTMFFIIGIGSKEVHKYTCSTAWTIVGATFTESSTVVTARETQPTDVVFNNDGTKMYVCGATGQDITYFTLATPYLLSSLSYVGEFSVAAQDTIPRGIIFNASGTKFIMVGDTNNSLYQYSLGIAYDMSTASYDTVSFSVSGQATGPNGIQFNNDGTKIYVIGAGTSIFQYSLGTPYAISSVTYDGLFFYVGNQDSGTSGLYFKSDGLKVFVSGATNDKIYEYVLSSAFSFSNARYANGFSINAWIKANTVGETAGIILNKSSSTSGQTGFNFQVLSGNKLGFILNAVANISSADGSVVFGDGNWYNVCVTISSSGFANFYVNGVLSGAADQFVGSPSLITGIMNSRIGNRSNATDRTFDGLIDDLKIYPIPLSALEVQSVYNTTKA